MKIGDNVRFLNSVGGGKVVKIDPKTNIVHVEDEDGFEIPVLMHECVIVNTINANNVPQKGKEVKATVAEIKTVEDKYIPSPELPVYETANGDTMQMLLAFIPLKIKELQTTDYDCVFINDGNYFVYYNIVSVQNGEGISLSHGLIEPNMQETIAKVPKVDLNKWENIKVQAIPFKKDKSYFVQHIFDVDIHINLVKFYKLHSFIANEYFLEDAMIFDIESEQQKNRIENISPEEFVKVVHQKESVKPIKKVSPTKRAEIIEVDLHINQLLDNTNGMSNADMLAFQMNVFHTSMSEHAKQKGQKIVFIHGKGEGVLRKEIEKALKKQYKNCSFQDASFREYGFGATMVTIH